MSERSLLTLNGLTNKNITRLNAIEIIASQPWAILPEHLEIIVSIANRYNDSPDMISEKSGRPLVNTRSVSTRNNVAIIPITGPIFRYANLFTEISGATSISVLAKDIREAVESESIESIILEINSPGGEATSIAELADRIREHSAQKKIISYIDGQGASAAYWLASAASEVVVSKTAIVGSIGTILTVDRNQSNDKIQIVSAQSPNKRPDVTTEEGRAPLQSIVDKLTTVFIESVATYRGVSIDTVLNDFGKGGVLIGSDAVNAGMADRIGSIESLITGLSGPKHSGGIFMSDKNTPADKPETIKPFNVTRQYLDMNNPDIVEAIKKEGYDEGCKAGAVSERDRIKSVESQLMPGHESLVESLKYDGETTGDQAASKVLAAEKLMRIDSLEKRKSDAPAPLSFVGNKESSVSKQAENLPIEDRCKSGWASDQSLHGEFGTLESYLAYERAIANGQAKIFKGGNK